MCSKCGTIKNSGKKSCCARGGSWFGTCGRGGNSKHAWYEGIRACKPQGQSKTFIGQHLNGAQQNSMDSFNGTGMSNSKAAITAAQTVEFTSVNNMLLTTSIITGMSVNTLIRTQGYGELLNVAVHISLLLFLYH